MDKNNPSYYAIIPAHVRYAAVIGMGAKMMYGEITALSSKEGYCFASNGYFAKLYDVTPQAISKWIKQLEQAGFVSIEYIGNKGEIERRVSITVDRGYQQELRVVSTTVEHNNTSSNNTSILSGKPDDVKGDPYKKERGQVIAHLNSVTGAAFKPHSKATRTLLDARLKEYPAADIIAVIDDRAARWQGTDMAEYLRPSTLFRPTNFENYLNSIGNRAGVVNTDEALADCVLAPHIEDSYQRYLAHACANYPDLVASSCRILSKSEYKELCTWEKYPGIAKTYTPRAVTAALHEAQAELNANKWAAKDNPNLFDYLRTKKLKVA